MSVENRRRDEDARARMKQWRARLVSQSDEGIRTLEVIAPRPRSSLGGAWIFSIRLDDPFPRGSRRFLALSAIVHDDVFLIL